MSMTIYFSRALSLSPPLGQKQYIFTHFVFTVKRVYLVFHKLQLLIRALLLVLLMLRCRRRRRRHHC